MGIIAEVTMEPTGLTLASAYIALSRSTVVLDPQGGSDFRVHSTCSIWNSYADRLANKRALELRPLSFSWSGDGIPDMYTAAYDHIKELFPGYVDEQAAAAAAAAEAAAEAAAAAES